MRDHGKTTRLLLALAACLATFTVTALENVSGHKLTAVTVELDPGTSAPPHTHTGFAFVYVLEGKVRQIK